MNLLLTILMPLGAFLLLVLYGAGIFPWTVIAATILLCLAARPWRGGKKKSILLRRGYGGQELETRNSKSVADPGTCNLKPETCDYSETTPDTRHPTPDKPPLRRNWATCSPLAPRAWLRPVMRTLWRSPFALLLLYLLLMLMPLPAGLTLPGNSNRTIQNQRVTETLEATSAMGIDHGVNPHFSLTRSRAGTTRFLLLAIMAYAGWSFTVSCTNTARTTLLRVVILIGSAMALAGILGKWVFPQGDTLWWWIPIPHGRPGPMGGFMNRNHFAGFCAILAPAALALAVSDATKRRPLLMLLNTVAALILSAGVLLSLSRGGMIALAAGLGMFVLIGLIYGTLRTRIAVLIAALILVGSVGIIAWQQPELRERIASLRSPLATQSAQDRLSAWRDARQIWQHYPILGAGPNAFRTVYPQHRNTSAREARDFAESEYAQWLCEAGAVGLLIAMLFAFVLLRDVRQTFTQSTSHDRILAAGTTAALAAATVHALVDFPLHLPLYALTVAAFAGTLREQSRKQKAESRNCDSTPNIQRPTCNLQPETCNLIACLVIALGLCFVDLQLDMDGTIIRSDFQGAAKALTAAPTSPMAWRRLAALLWQAGTPEQRQLSERCLTQAAAYDPNNYRLWLRLGERRQELGDNVGAMQAYQRVKALRSWVKVPTHLPEEN